MGCTRKFRINVFVASFLSALTLTSHNVLGQVETAEQKQQTDLYGSRGGPTFPVATSKELIESAQKQEREREDAHIRNAKLALLALALLFGIAVSYRYLLRILKSASNQAADLAASGAASTIKAKRAFQDKVNERLDH